MIRVLIADDHRLFRQALHAMLAHEADIQVVGEAQDGNEVLKLAPRAMPDIVIMDVAMTRLNGVEATSRLIKKCPGVRVLGLSAHPEKYFIVQMLSAGACGYVVKMAGREELLRGIRSVAEGHVYVCAKGIEALGDLPVWEARGAPAAALGRREREVLQLIAEGKSSAEIALCMHIATGTVEVHRRNIMRKLNLHSIAELTKHAIRIGLTSP